MANLKEKQSLPPDDGRLRIRSAMYPMVWISGVIGIPSIIALGWGNNHSVAIAIALYSVVGVTLLSFLFLLVRDPDRLQTRIYMPERNCHNAKDEEMKSTADKP